jgi:hypothetical protein
MNLDDNIQENIQRYLTEKMTEEERTDFEKQIAESPDIANEVRTWREFRVVAKNKMFFQVASALDKWMSEVGDNPAPNEYDSYFQDPPPSLSFWQKTMGRSILRGGIFLCMLGVAFGGYRAIKQQQQEKVIAQIVAFDGKYMIELDNFVQFAPNNTSPFKEMLRLYDAHKYREAAQFYETAEGIKTDETAQLFAAICYLLTDDTQKGVDILRGLNKAQFMHRDMAQRYLALALLKRKQNEEAIILLKSLKTDDRFGREAENILKQLGENQ